MNFPSQVTIEHNFVTGNDGHGIDVGEEVAETVIRGNAVGQNTGAGVHVYEAVDTTIDDNDIDDNGRDGVDLLVDQARRSSRATRSPATTATASAWARWPRRSRSAGAPTSIR